MPVIACTANALQGEAQACFAAGMDDFLVKPVELSALVAKLQRWLPTPQESAQPALEPGPVPGVAPATAPIDQALLKGVCGDDPAMVTEVLAALRRTCEDDSAALAQAQAAGDAAEVSRCAHRMAGASRMVGALGFAAACEQIERAGRAGDWQALREGMAGFERERARLVEWLAGRRETA